LSETVALSKVFSDKAFGLGAEAVM